METAAGVLRLPRPRCVTGQLGKHGLVNSIRDWGIGNHDAFQ